MKLLLFLLFVAPTVLIAQEKGCIDDVLEASVEIGQAVASGIAANASCSSDDTTIQCIADVTILIEDLADASLAIEEAVGNCGGTANECAEDITATVSVLADATKAVDLAIADCSKNSTTKLACIQDVADAVADLSQAGIDIALAVRDCASNPTVS